MIVLCLVQLPLESLYLFPSAVFPPVSSLLVTLYYFVTYSLGVVCFLVPCFPRDSKFLNCLLLISYLSYSSALKLPFKFMFCLPQAWIWILPHSHSLTISCRPWFYILSYQWYSDASHLAPLLHNNKASPGMSESESHISAYNNVFIKSKLLQQPLTQTQYFVKYARKLFPLETKTANSFHQLKQKCTIKHNQAHWALLATLHMNRKANGGLK